MDPMLTRAGVGPTIDPGDERRSAPMEPTRELIDQIYREKVLRARRTPLRDKLLSGADIFEEVYERMAAGVRAQHPGADDAAVLEIIRGRLKRLDRIRGRR
jgi:hypothetical protein